MGWLGNAGEFLGSFGASFVEHRARTKRRTLGSSKADGDIAAYDAVTKGLKDCLPMDDHVTRRGLRAVCNSLKRNDHLGAQLAIDANPGLRKREICVYLLKSAVTYLCSEDPSNLVRGATYTIIACK
jgi:hypothetical protein